MSPIISFLLTGVLPLILFIALGNYMAKIQITWRVNRSQLSAIANAISPDSFSATFFDPTTASTKTCTMYAGDRSATMVLNADTAAETLWDLSVNFIEY